MPNLHNTFHAIDKIKQKFSVLVETINDNTQFSIWWALKAVASSFYINCCASVVVVVVIIVLNKKMNRKVPYYYFIVLITYLLAYLICSSATTYRKSNNPSRNLFPLSLIHINDFHARYKCWLNLSWISRVDDLNSCFFLVDLKKPMKTQPSAKSTWTIRASVATVGQLQL